MTVLKAGLAWRITPFLLILCLAFGCAPGLFGSGPAWAQDDDGGDDDGGDDAGGDDAGGDDAGGEDAGGDDVGGDDDGNAGSAGGDDSTAPAADQAQPDAPQPDAPQSARPNTARRPAAVAIVERPERAPDELVVTGLNAADFAALTAEGFELIERQPILANGPEVFRLRIPRDQTLTTARDRVRTLPTGDNADFNHYYRHSEDPLPVAAPADSETCAHLNCQMQDLIAWPAVRSMTCRVTVPVAVIDTGINPDHAGFAGANIELVRLPGADEPNSSATHGTAVISLLVGQEKRAPGLVPEATVLAVDIFTREAGDERADVVSLIRALDLVVQRGVRVANLSLAGPENTVLTDMLRTAEAAGVLVVAAAGNAGPAAPPAWPAAHEGALAVTAVDPDGRIYRRAQRGPHIDIAAPGVEVWAAASVSGVKPRTGTSFAAPLVTAAAAVLASRHPDWTTAELAAALRAMTADAGAEGADEVFGAGIMSAVSLCGAGE